MKDHIPISLLEKYIEKYPEDVEKWLEFINIQEPQNTVLNNLRGEILQEQLLNSNMEVFTQHTSEEGAVQPEVINHETGCVICNKLWSITETIPRCTMLCGHTFHTVCILNFIYSNDNSTCGIENCSVNTYDYIREIHRRKRENKETIEGILIKSLINEKSKKSGFNGDLKLLKKYISNYKSLRQKIYTAEKIKRKELIHKHLYSLNNINQDMNNSLKDLRTSGLFLEFRRSLKQYRKHAAYVYRRYHLSLKDLIDNKLIKTSWGTRWELQRHRPFIFSKLKIRLFPGSKPFKDPIDATDT